MMPGATFELPGILGLLLRASLEGGLFAIGLWGALRFFPRIPASLRCWLWWAVSLKFLLGLAGLPVLELPLLPAPAPTAAPSVVLWPAPAVAPDAAASILPTAVAATTAAPWTSFVLGLWLAGVGLALALLVREVLRARGLLATARPVEPSHATQLFAELCRRFRLRSARLSTSAEVASPQVLGLLRPHVLLPRPSLERLSPGELAMALAHELAHVMRGDLLLGWVPALARRIFFFHPLAALAAREYALAREAACDAEVLRVLGSAPQSYGRLLLRWGVVPRETGLAAAAAAPSLRTLKRRLSMLDHATPLSGRRRAAWWLAAGAVATLGVLPVRLVSASRPVPPTPPVAPVAPVAPVTQTVSAIPAPPPLAAPPAPPRVAPPPVPAVAPPPPPPAPPRMAAMAGSSGQGFSYSYSSDDDGNGWVYLKGGSNTFMSGSSDDLKKAMKLRHGSDEPLLYFREDGKAYVVRDPALLAQLEALYEPLRKIGEAQGAIGEKQGALGEKQGKIGEQQGRIGARQGEIGAKLGELAARQARGAQDPALDVEMERLSDEMDRLGQEMEKLGEPMDELGRQMEAYGDDMEELGTQMEAMSQKVERQMHELMEKAIATGLAEAVKEARPN